MTTCVPATPECSTTNTAAVAVTGTWRTTNIPGEPVCRTVVSGADQTSTPSPAN